MLMTHHFIGISLLLLVAVGSAAAQTSTNADPDLIERVRIAMNDREGPRQELIEELGNAQTAECECLLYELLSFNASETSEGMPAVWRSMIEEDVRVQAARQLIRIGSPRVVPTLRRWLAEGVTNFKDTMTYSKHLAIAIEGLGQFHDTESLPLIIEQHNQPASHRVHGQITAKAIAVIGANDSTELLRKILWNDSYNHEIRCDAAEALVRLYIAVGGDALLAFYEVELVELKHERRGTGVGARAHLAKLGDPELIQRLKERAEREPPSSIQKNIYTLIADMELCALPLECMVALAESDNWENAHKRYGAISRLGREGSLQHIQLLSALKPWTRDGPSAYEIQQQTLQTIAANAIAEIKRRHWKELEQ